MKKAIAVALICSAASLAFAGTVLLAQAQSGKTADVQLTPLNVKTGLWQTTSTVKYTGLPPQMAAAFNSQITSKSCLKPEDLDAKKWTAKELSGLKCSSLTVLKSTATDIEAEGKGCEVNEGVTADGHGKFHVADPGHVTGTLDVTWSGSTPYGNLSVHGHGEYVDKWLGATCPAGVR